MVALVRCPEAACREGLLMTDIRNAEAAHVATGR